MRELHAADISSTQPQARQPTRLPRPDGGSLGTRGAVAPPQEGPQAADGAGAEQARRLLTEARAAAARFRLTRASADYGGCSTVGGGGGSVTSTCSGRTTQAGHPRMGLIVPKFQSTAVARNRLRRRLREIWRRELQCGRCRRGTSSSGRGATRTARRSPAPRRARRWRARRCHEPMSPFSWPRRVVAMVLIRGYQRVISPALAAELPVHARVVRSTLSKRSHATASFEAAGSARGASSRCHPFHPGRLRPGSLTLGHSLRLWIVASFWPSC